MPPALAPLPFPSFPITSNIRLQYPTGNFEIRQQLQPQDSILDTSYQRYWTAPGRAGLPTPPGDMMNGVAYNTFLPSTAPSASSANASSYGGKYNGLSLDPYSKLPSRYRPTLDRSSSSSSSVAMASSKPQSHAPSSAKYVPPSESGNQRKTASNNGLPSYLQIPTTISESRGNLAEFAAQVRFSHHHCIVCRG